MFRIIFYAMILKQGNDAVDCRENRSLNKLKRYLCVFQQVQVLQWERPF
jgi:hypothetical protein